MIDVHGSQPWYVERPEPELDVLGTLESAPRVTGPGNRPTLSFVLRTPGGAVDVYAAGVEDTLASLSGRRMRFRGKAVDAGLPGASPELWIGSACPVDE
ncbi:hypothetical protein [Streptomyces atratus]|uniref:Uncharacterized protein n=1 Tax=Streptomyces atratus TaxID=1893 RepID=A0A1K1ZY59_STRAR|nr:hypothetical protein SAMN02787144_1006136 [Streptomyces atratus]